MAEKEKSIKTDKSEVPADETENGTAEKASDAEGGKSQEIASDCGKENKTDKNEATPEALQQKLDAEKDRLLRLNAEFDNYKKRSSREMADFKKFANEMIFKDLLTVVDNLERAIVSGEESTETNPILEGVKLTHKEILKIFQKFNVKTVEAEGKPFDPSYHQAVTHQESDDHPDNTVVKELQKGYLLSDRLIRPSMVIVSKSESKN